MDNHYLHHSFGASSSGSSVSSSGSKLMLTKEFTNLKRYPISTDYYIHEMLNDNIYGKFELFIRNLYILNVIQVFFLCRNEEEDFFFQRFRNSRKLGETHRES